MYGDDSSLLFCYCIGYLLVIVLWIYIATRVYHRAEELGMSATLWAIIVFLFSLLALLIFWAVSSDVARKQAAGGTAGYPIHSGVYGGQSAGQAPAPEARTGPPDPDFRDEHLEELIEDGKLSEARKYLREMINMAREMNDQTGLRNYANYEPKINKAAMEGTRRRKDY